MILITPKINWSLFHKTFAVTLHLISVNAKSLEGNFNVDYDKKYYNNYTSKHMFEGLEDSLQELIDFHPNNKLCYVVNNSKLGSVEFGAE